MQAQLRCCYCSATHPIGGLTERRGYRGGSGYEWTCQCADMGACWRRREREAQLVEMQAELERTRERRVLA
jgi:hypothetical protein